MRMNLTYWTFILLATLGMVMFGLFVRAWRRRGQLRNEEKNLKDTHQQRQVQETIAKKIMEDARKHRQQS